MNELELKKECEKDVEIVISKKSQYMNACLSFMCGYEELNDILDEKKMDLQKQNETKRRIENFYSLNQSKFEKIILNFNLVLILIIAVSLYVFFSIPPQLHIFKNVRLSSNQTLN